MRAIVTFIIIIISTGQMVFGQNYCGTTLSLEQKEWLKKHQQNPQPPSKAFEEVTYMPIQFHIVGRDDGTGYYSEPGVYTMLCKLNDDFRRTNMQFYIRDGINYVNNTPGYSQEDYADGYQLMAGNKVAGVVNVFIVSYAVQDGICGYYAPSEDAIVVRQSCTGADDTTLTHELGHYFSLPHPFDGWEHDTTPPPHRQERVLRNAANSNCDDNDSGDGFCDTPADYASFAHNCPLSVELFDPDGYQLDIDDKLFMSYSATGCKTRFSPQQLAAMKAFAEDWRPYLLDDEPNITTTDLARPLPIYPSNFAEVPSNNVRLQWTAVPGADKYHVELRAPSNQYKEYFLISSNNLTLDLDEGYTYFWRVTAISPGNYCAGYFSQHRFYTKEASDLQINSIDINSPTCTGDQDGFLSVTFNNGNTETLENIPAGVHEINQENAAGETVVYEFKVSNPDPIITRVEQLKNGVMAVQSTKGGTPPYTYFWNDDIEGVEAANLPGGENVLKIVDSNGCEEEQTVRVILPVVDLKNVPCNNSPPTGSFEIIEVLGIGTSYEEKFRYNYDPVEDWTSLEPGAYVLTIIDFDGDFDTEVQFDYTIQEAGDLLVEINVAGNEASLDIINGSPPYLTVWSNGASYQNEVSDLAVGEYWVYVEDDAGCTLEIPFTITSVGINDATESGFLLYPNPSNGDVAYLSVPADQELDALNIFSAEGRLLKQLNTSGHSSKIAIDLNGLDAGVYLLQLQGEESSFMKLMVR